MMIFNNQELEWQSLQTQLNKSIKVSQFENYYFVNYQLVRCK